MARSRNAMAFMLLLTAVVLAGCGRVSTYGPPPGAVDPLDDTRSLIASDAAVLSDQEIARILTTRVEVPQQMRVAVLYLAHESEWSRYGGFSLDGFRGALDPVQKLRDDGRVFDVSFLPSFLLPAEKSIPLIREAAARYQADWVLIVKTTSRGFRNDRVFGTDEARAACEAECAVLDVRTGTIPFTSVAAGEATVAKVDGEFSLRETSLRAEGEAVALAMVQNVEGLLAFLDRLSDS